MAISEQAEARMISARAARNKQNAKIPFLINVKDGRLIPNVPAIAGRPAETTTDGKTIPAKKPHPDYRPFTGSVKASLDERLAWIASLGGHASAAPRAVSLANLPAFDLGTATVDELIEFAQEEYKEKAAHLSKTLGLKALRKEVARMAEEAGAVVAGPAEEDLG